MNRTHISHMTPRQRSLFLSYHVHRLLTHALIDWGYLVLGIRGKHAK